MTTGAPLDPDGYTLELDGAIEGTIGVNDAVVFGDLDPGNHQVVLADVADNCFIHGSQSRGPAVVAGDTVPVPFEIECRVPPPLEIVFVEDGGRRRVFAMAADGSRKTQLSTAENAWDPQWSPDGTQIAFATGPSTCESTLWVMDADGSTARALTQGARPSWSPDGLRIAFDTCSGSGGIWVIDTSGANAAPIISGDYWGAAWSPDGARIAFSTSGWTIDAVDPDGQNRATIFSGSGLQFPRDVAWSPDGSRLAFTANDGTAGISALRIIDSDGSNLTTVTVTAGTSLEDYAPDFLPAGTGLVFQRTDWSDFTSWIMRVGLTANATPIKIARGSSPHWKK